MDGDVKAIELQGIVRNKTKLNVEDGQAEDLLNLRFVDGSWRTSGDGRKVWAFVYHGAPNEQVYSQIYVHTNIYRHLLGVRDGKLYWFADIATDGVTFTPKATPQELTSVTGDIWITQTGHLLTVIDEVDNFEYLVFKTGNETYKKIVVDEKGKQSDRGLFQFGQIHFNLEHNRKYNVIDYSAKVATTISSLRNGGGKQEMNDLFINKMKLLTERNLFFYPIAVVCAIKLYDGSYVFATNPVILNYGENSGNVAVDINGNVYRDKEYIYFYNSYIGEFSPFPDDMDDTKEYGYFIKKGADVYIVPLQSNNDDVRPTFWGDNYDDMVNHLTGIYTGYGEKESSVTIRLVGYNILFTILGIEEYIKNNTDIFKSICIFVTPEIPLWDLSSNGEGTATFVDFDLQGYSLAAHNQYASYEPAKRDKEIIIHELVNSPFYLWYEMPIQDISDGSFYIDLSDPGNNGLLSNITQQPTLPTEAFNRQSYLPKYGYQYNGRLHIANYKSRQFHGYPLDLFHLHNHSLRASKGSYFKGVIADYVSYNDEYLQYPKTEYSFLDGTANANDRVSAKMKQNGDVFAQIIVTLQTNNGEQKVVRYIDTTSVTNGTGKFFEDLNPLLTFPDYRATKMQIRTMRYAGSPGYVYVTDKTFNLKPHPLYNFAYYIDPNLKPIRFDDMGSSIISYNDYAFGSTPANPLVPEQNTEEYFPNGLKVSKTDNPMFFPVENTYQVGSGEILAMCSNAIAVGTGQTGAAPLYVFCTDGIYALFVDSSGEMTYTNARVIARDVLNNPRSVTPIDEGVVFTTDRGLMMIAGEQVKEIGQPAEGDVLQYADPNNPDHIKIADGALTKVADFPNSICDKTDFLTYLTGAIVNYNHNERELMISNPAKDYSYILDRNGNWSRRDYSADEYILNYPTSYRLRNGEFYKVDEEGDDNTPLEEKKEADNKFFYLSNIIKLGTISFKQAARFVVRGFFNTKTDHIGCYIFGSYDGRKWAMLGGNEKTGTFTDIGCKIERTDVRFFRICLAGQMKGDSRIDYMEISSEPSMLNSKIR